MPPSIRRHAVFAIAAWFFWLPSVVYSQSGENAWQLMPCEPLDSVIYLAEPWESHTRLYEQDEVRLAIIDRLEPAASAVHLLVLTHPFDHAGIPACYRISRDKRYGFAEMDLPDTVELTQKQSLSFDLPVAYYDASQPDSKRWETLVVSIKLGR